MRWKAGPLAGCQRCGPLILRCNYPSLLLYLIQQQRCEFVIAQTLYFACVIADHELKVDLIHFLGNQTVWEPVRQQVAV